MRTETPRRNQGFTVLELMIAVAIIGVLASVAIPSLRVYQWKAKRSEAYTNLGALAKAQTTYYALNDLFFGVADAEPGNTLSAPNDVPSENNRESSAVDAAFGPVGWAPEGRVFYDYDVNVNGLSGGGCTCSSCFTLTAYGNVDGDATGGAVMYVRKGTQGNECKSILFGMSAPLHPQTGVPIYDSPAPNTSQDNF